MLIMDPESGAPLESELLRSNQEGAVHKMAEAARGLESGITGRQALDTSLTAPSAQEVTESANKGEGVKLRLGMYLPGEGGVDMASGLLKKRESVDIDVAISEGQIQMLKETIAAYEAAKQKK